MAYNSLVGMEGGATQYAMPPNQVTNTSSPNVTGVHVIDGTPVRVAMLGLSAAFVIAALRWSGFRFNVGVS